MYQQLKEKLRTIVKENQIKTNEPMKLHTTFRIGGPADYYITPANEAELKEIVSFCHSEKVPFYIIGNGSNLLVGDYGFHGIIIEIKDTFAEIAFSETEDRTGMIVKAGAGILLSKMARLAADKSLTGFEFASGIPGTLGGAVAMNAGAYGGEIKDAVISAKVMTMDGELKNLSKEELELSYRSSVVMKKQYIVTEAVFQFNYGEKESILTQMKELNGRRREKQPLEFPSAGSTFKRPEGYFAGKLIMDAGLRGFRVGDIMVSEKHCGFVVNVGNGTAAQVKELIAQVTEKVENQFGVTLEPEVRLIGEFKPRQEEIT